MALKKHVQMQKYTAYTDLSILVFNGSVIP
jgi:hypothetical protein